MSDAIDLPRPASRARVAAAALVDIAIAAPPGALAGASLAAALAELPIAGAAALVTAGAWASWAAYRTVTDRRGRGVGRWLTGTRLVTREGAAPSVRAAALHAATGAPFGLVPAAAESVSIAERAGGAAGRNKSWLALSAGSIGALVLFGGVLFSRIHLGADRATWNGFHHAHHELACCAGPELPREWETCAIRIEAALAVRAHGHSDPDVLSGRWARAPGRADLGRLLDSCPARRRVEEPDR